MRSDNIQPQLLFKGRSTTGMINMAMRKDNFFRYNTGFFYRLQNIRNISTRIDNGRLHGFGAPDEAAILLQGCDWHDHGT